MGYGCQAVTVPLSQRFAAFRRVPGRSGRVRRFVGTWNPLVLFRLWRSNPRVPANLRKTFFSGATAEQFQRSNTAIGRGRIQVPNLSCNTVSQIARYLKRFYSSGFIRNIQARGLSGFFRIKRYVPTPRVIKGKCSTQLIAPLLTRGVGHCVLRGQNVGLKRHDHQKRTEEL